MIPRFRRVRLPFWSPLGVLLGLLVWWWLSRRPKTRVIPVSTAETPPPEPEAEEPKQVPSTPDDLTRIRGIGPKCSGVLHSAGITTFAQLAASEMSRLEQILRQGEIRIAYPDTWPEQASLAAAGEWSALEALQSELKSGKKS